MEYLKNVIQSNVNLRKYSIILIFSALYLITLLVVSVNLFVNSQIYSNKLTASLILSNASTTISKQVIPVELGSITSDLGFSLKYPYKEIGSILEYDKRFKVNMFFPPSIISLDATSTTDLYDDIVGLGLVSGVTISVIENNTLKTDFKSWIKNYISNKENQYGKNETILLQKISSSTFAGMNGYVVNLSIEGPKSQLSPHYTRNEIFVTKRKLIFRISTLSSSIDTTFPRSGLLGKQYLQRVDDISKEILKTFAFDKSKETGINIPKLSALKLTGISKYNREKLLSALRSKPFFDEKETYPDPPIKCESGISAIKTETKNDLDLSQAIYISVDGGNADIHAYDSYGRHTGYTPVIPWLGGPSVDENIVGVDFNSYSKKQTLSIRENLNGRIEIIGKEYGLAKFEVSGEGNSCNIVYIDIPVTPYSVATLPMTKEGDIGPFSYDIDGDGMQDFTLSLLHPLLPQKLLQVYDVINDMVKVK